MSRRAADKKASAMLRAMGSIGAGREAGTPFTHSIRSDRGRVHTWARDRPRSRGSRAASQRRVPPQSGHTSSFTNFSTRFMPASSFTLARAFSTVAVAL